MTYSSTITALNMEASALEQQTLNSFLIAVERRAYRMALISLGDSDDALDVVQDSMIKLASRYADKPAEQWRPLFYRILRNRINDLHRRNSVRHRFRGFLPGQMGNEDDDKEDPFQVAPDPAGRSPEHQLESNQQMLELEAALKSLPRRQREAFMLRCWEGLSTAETANAMRCGEGSVKTHYSRALHALRSALESSDTTGSTGNAIDPTTGNTEKLQR